MSNHANTETTTRRTAAFNTNRIAGWEAGATYTPAQARTLAFDWDVASSPIIAGNNFEAIETHKVNYRTDTGAPVGVVGSTYGVVTNDTFVDFAEATGLMAHSAGVRNGGSQVWMQLEVPGGEVLPGVDPHARYVWMCNSHDGSGSMIVRPTMTRISCMNQWQALRKNHRMGGEVTLRHTSKVEDRVAAARVVIAQAFDRLAHMESDIRRLIESDTTRLVSLVEATFGRREGLEGRKLTNWNNRYDEIGSIYTSETCEQIVGSDYGRLMAINEWELNRGANADPAGRVINGLGYTEKAAELLLA